MEALRSSESFKSQELHGKDCDPEFPVMPLMVYPLSAFPDEDYTVIPLDPPADPLPDKPKILIDADVPLPPRQITNGVIPGTCMICSLVDEHSPIRCPYRKFIPKNATVNGCDIVCKDCGRLFSGHCCKQDAGRAIVRVCNNCLMFGDHWTSQCPKEDRFLLDLDV